MFRVKTYNKISEKGLSLFDGTDYSVSADTEDPHALLLRSHKLHEEPFSDALDCIARAGAGVNNIPIDRCSSDAIVVFNTPGANANAVKELVFTGMFLSSRDIIGGINFAKGLSENGSDYTALIESNKSKFSGSEIQGKKLAVVGLGAIGLMVANSAVSLGLEVEGYDPFLSVNNAWELSSSVKPAASLEKMLQSADFISIHVPFTEETKQFFNEDLLSSLKEGAVLLNFSRDGLVDHDALLESLDNGPLRKYVTDFPSKQLVQNDHVIPIPHLGASTQEAEENCAVMVANQVMDFLENGNIKNSVNFPHCVLDRGDAKRVTITNKNIPNVIGQISTILADNGNNIIEMMNKSRGDLAYNIVDYSGDLTQVVLDQLSSIEGVIKVKDLS